MRKLILITMLLLTAKVASGAEPDFPPECPGKGTMEAVDNPSEWADQCFKAVNGRLPSANNPGEIDSIDRDIDLDGTLERLEIRGVGNKLKQIYVFQNSNRIFKYMGVLIAHPEFFVAKDQDNQTVLLNIYRSGVGMVYFQRIQYVEREFIVVREDLMQ
jgi:hypothetical protein